MSGSCAIYVPENDLFFAIVYALAICHFAWPRKTDPTKSPEKEFFPEFPKGNLTLGGVRFPGRTQVENLHCAGFPPFGHPSINLTKICYIDQSPWDNSDLCGIFWLGWLMDVGRYEGVAPSMCAFAT